MNLRDVTMALAGGAMIYGAMTACTGGETMSGAHADDGASRSAACECEPRKPQVDVVQCDPKTGTVEVEYPGASREELVGVVALSARHMPDGELSPLQNLRFGDGFISADCWGGEPVTVVRP